METIVLTVSQLNRYIKGIVEQDRVLCRVILRGEISNFKAHFSGHFYFALKDETSVIKAVMFKSYASALKFVPESGQKVIVSGRVGVFERDGQYQIYVDSMEPDGLGALNMAYEQLKAKLEGEGLFDTSRKKAIPPYPSKIGVVTSPTGAAVRDILNILKRRYKLADVYIYPVLVQGPDAPSEIAEAINYFDKSGWADVLIVGRGGGSIEDLWAFNDENVARAVAECKIPVISAVGHETDFTIIDFVADLRAPTPSAAAELAVPDGAELAEKMTVSRLRLANGLRANLQKKKQIIEGLKGRPVYKNPESMIEKRRQMLDMQSYLMVKQADIMLSKHREVLSKTASKLDALSPLAVLGRGYSVVKKQGRVLKSVKDAEIKDKLEVILTDGNVICEVLDYGKNDL